MIVILIIKKILEITGQLILMEKIKIINKIINIKKIIIKIMKI